MKLGDIEDSLEEGLEELITPGTEGGRRKRKKLLDPEGAVMSFLTKTGELIILDGLWIISCLPLFTAGAATAAMYYTIVKNIRHGRGSLLKEYTGAFKRCFGRGTAVTLIVAAWTAALYRLMYIANSSGSDQGSFLMRIYTVIAAVSLGILIYTFPVLSRFTLNTANAIKLAFVMAGRYIHFTLIMILGTGALIYLGIFKFPVVLTFLLPGIWTFIESFMIEKALRHYMPEPDDDMKNEWMYE